MTAFAPARISASNTTEPLVRPSASMWVTTMIFLPLLASSITSRDTVSNLLRRPSKSGIDGTALS